jgi:hypothetical protein
MRMIYRYGPAGDVAHWRQELDGTLPRRALRRRRCRPTPARSAPKTEPEMMALTHCSEAEDRRF